jgi:hypothetical protein
MLQSLASNDIAKSATEHRQSDPHEAYCAVTDGFTVACLDQTDVTYNQAEDGKRNHAPVQKTDNTYRDSAVRIQLTRPKPIHV